MLHMAGKKDTFLSGKLSPFSVGQQDRGGVCLESSDGLGLACLSHHVHSLQGTHGSVHVLVNKRGQRIFMFRSTNVDRGSSCFGQQTWTEALHVSVNKQGQRMFIFWSTTPTKKKTDCNPLSFSMGFLLSVQWHPSKNNFLEMKFCWRQRDPTTYNIHFSCILDYLKTNYYIALVFWIIWRQIITQPLYFGLFEDKLLHSPCILDYLKTNYYIAHCLNCDQNNKMNCSSQQVGLYAPCFTHIL